MRFIFFIAISLNSCTHGGALIYVELVDQYIENDKHVYVLELSEHFGRCEEVGALVKVTTIHTNGDNLVESQQIEVTSARKWESEKLKKQFTFYVALNDTDDIPQSKITDASATSSICDPCWIIIDSFDRSCDSDVVFSDTTVFY